VPGAAARLKREMVAMMFWYGGHWLFWQASLMWVGMIVFWGLLIWGIYALIKTANRKPGDDERRPPADERGGGARRILDERLARGEINPEEYRHLVDVLNGDRTPASSGKAS
jgi:putative membrane protein